MTSSLKLAAFLALASAARGAATPKMPTFHARRGDLIANESIRVADTNGDGIPDLIASEYGTILVQLGSGDGTFRPGPNTRTGAGGGMGFIATDLNGDGRIDLALSNGSGIVVSLGNGDGTFQTGVNYPANDTAIGDLVVGDFNGDGILVLKLFTRNDDHTKVTASASTPTVTPTVRERSLAALGKLPPFSPILNRLIASLAAEEVSFAKIADLIEKDTVLAGNILKLVNSALYGLAKTVNSIRHAVSLLGINKLRNAALSMSVARMWSQVKTPPGWSTANFNQHSVGVGILSDLLAQRLQVQYAEGAFAAGLFHDLGLMLVAIGLQEEYKQLSLLCQQTNKWDPEYEVQVLGMTHAELSAEALAQWNLPEEIQTAVRYHGSPELDPTPLEPGQVTLSRILNAADRYVKGTGVFVSVFESPVEDANSALEQLGLGERLPVILTEFDNEFTAIKSYF